MRRRPSMTTKLFAALAVILGGGAFLVVHGYAARVEALAPALGEPVTVTIAADTIPRGTVLSPDTLKVMSVPARFAPPGAVHSPGSAAGRTLLADLAAGEPLTWTRLAPKRAGPVAALVPPGLRAFPVATSLPPGAVRPGDRVDVLGTFAGGQPHTETVASGLEVLLVMSPRAAGSASGLGDAGAPETSGAGQTLVLVVRPDQAEQLAYARAFADLTVSVLGPEEVITPG